MTSWPTYICVLDAGQSRDILTSNENPSMPLKEKQVITQFFLHLVFFLSMVIGTLENREKLKIY